MTNKKQSSVQWLFEQVVNLDWRNMVGEEKIKIFQQAKEMHKQEIVDAYDIAVHDAFNFDIETQESDIYAQSYYTDTFEQT